MARRDAVRLPAGSLAFTGVIDILLREAKAGRHVVRLRGGETLVEELAAVAAEGIAVESVPGVPPKSSCQVVTFPVREDIRNAILKAAS
jgi:uroporphyrin-III C-methyltransferase / precorrin-2 dehydrogenase / sirohydrochlorin ferrochelatase